MKKYLITGAMALVAGFYLTSCTHDDVGYDNLYDEKTQSFEKVFKDLYGTIDPNHDWGFTPFADIEDGTISTTTSGTRAGTRGHNANANEWAATWVVPNALTEAQKDKVRRWFQQNRNPEGVAFSHKDFFVQQVYKGGTNTAGSESPEKYTAANGGLITGSNQMDLLTCGSYGEGAQTTDDEGHPLNQGHNYYDHINNFNNGTYSGGGTVNVLDNGQPVNGGTTHPDQIMLMVDSKSDCFGFWNSAGSIGFNNRYVIIPGDIIQEWDSSGGDNANVSGMWFVGLDYDQRVESAYTNEWYTGPDGNQYRYLNSDMNQYCGEKILRDPEPTGADAQKLLNDGYLPVSGSANKTWVKLASCADGFYSDWIVRVIPGTKRSGGGGEETHEETTNSKSFRARCHKLVARGRVFVEDLYNANRADIDYNDAVFDGIIWYDYNVKVVRDDQNHETVYTIDDSFKKYRVEMALLAAGGTIPLTIAGDRVGDVHNAFGVGLTTIVNTVGEASNVFGSSVTGKNYVYREFDLTDEVRAARDNNEELTLNLIPIDVEWITGDIKVAARLNNKDTHTYKKDENGRLVKGDDGQPIVVESGAPVVPHVIQVPIGTAWPQERVNIGLNEEGPYHKFPDYVSNHKVKFWNSDVDNFYLYQDNPSPLAYSNEDTYPNNYTYYSEIGDIVWEGSQELWNYNDPRVTPQPADLFSNIQTGQRVRLYGEIINPANFWKVELFGGQWGDALLVASSDNDLNFSKNNGYVEVTVNDNIRTILTQQIGWGQACIVQGDNFRLKNIAIVK